MIVVITVAAMLYVLVAVPALTVKAGLVARRRRRNRALADRLARHLAAQEREHRISWLERDLAPWIESLNR